MNASCKTCINSVGASLSAAKRLRKEGYSQGPILFNHDTGLVCVRHKVVGPEPSYRCGWEREPGSDDE